jgi:hypothetical protein
VLCMTTARWAKKGKGDAKNRTLVVSAKQHTTAVSRDTWKGCAAVAVRVDPYSLSFRSIRGI